MTKKDELVKLFKTEREVDLESIKDEPKKVSDHLNAGSQDLRDLFREAVEEASEPAVGMALLFGE